MSEQMNDLPGLAIRRPYLISVVNLLIILAGVSALLGIEVRELPDIDRPIVSVRANYPGGAPETIDAEITSRIEGAVARVNGIESVRSSSEENNLRIFIEFNPSIDLIDAANDVREAVSRIERDLPDGVENITVIKADDDARAIIQLSAFSETLPIDVVTKMVEDQVIPELTAVHGVADVQIYGDRARVMKVAVDPIKLASYRLTVADLVTVLKTAHYDVPAGSFKSNDLEVLVRANASVKKPQEIEDLIVREPVRVGDVAHAYFSPAEASNYVRLDGRGVINLGIIRRAQSNTVAISNDVRQVVERLNERMRDLKIVTISDDSQFIEGAINEVLFSLILAMIIVVLVIALFMGQWRIALIPAVAMPVALIGTLAAIWLLGFSINLISLLALVLATGLVVDDTIVVLENIQRLRAQGIAPRAASLLGTREVFFAVIATTATLISVFLPISFIPSSAGRLFTEFGFVLAVAVSISSFVALTLCPMIAAQFRSLESEAPASDGGIVENKGRREVSGGAGFILAGLSEFGTTIKGLYGKALNRILLYPLRFVLACLMVMTVSAGLYLTLAVELVPDEDRGLITVRLVGPDGTGLPFADRQVEAVEALIKPYEEQGVVRSIFSITGRGDPNRGYIEAPLVHWDERSVSQADIIKKLNPQLKDIPGAQVRIQRGNSLNLRNADGGLKFAITGANYSSLAEEAEKLVLAIERDLPILQNLRVEFRATQPQLDVTIDRRRAADLGVSIDELASTIKVLVDDDEVAELSIDDEAVPIMLQALPGAVRDPSDLARLYVRNDKDQLIPLSQLLRFKEYAVAAELDRHGQRRAIELDADVVDGASLKEAVDGLRLLAAKELPVGTGIIFLGSAAELDKTSGDVAWTYLIALLVVFLVLIAQFENILSALIVMLIVPFGVAAAVIALFLTGTSINIYSQIGVLMLIGIMAKNSILMVEFADQLREKGRNVLEAAREASLVRLRPIVMTMVSTILAGLPLIVGSGPGSESRAAIGWVVFGGLGIAGLFTLFLTPVIYVLVLRLVKSDAAVDVDEEIKPEQEQDQGQGTIAAR